MILTDFQQSIIDRALPILLKHRLVYLSMETRTGKTPVSIMLCQRLCESNGVKQAVFCTKKSVTPAIQKTLSDLKQDNRINIDIQIVSFDSLHKIDHAPNRIIIADEAHSFGAYPKPSRRTIMLAGLSRSCYVIFLSATPTPESFSQIYHQLWAARSESPLIAPYRNFYAWARDYVDKRDKFIGAGRKAVDYSHAKKELILPYLEELSVSGTQTEANFRHTAPKESIVEIEMPEEIKDLIISIKKNQIAEYMGRTIIADTAASQLSKISQLCSGTVITEEESEGIIVSTYKTKILKLLLIVHKRIAVYYSYKAEREMLISVFNNVVIEDALAFERGNGNMFIAQFVSGREGLDLKSTNCIVFFNIQHSYLSYAQTINRAQNINRDKPFEIVFLMSKGGIEKKVLDCVKNKRKYTTAHFKKDFKTITSDLS